jgi:small conductance mechanosensitive channel
MEFVEPLREQLLSMWEGLVRLLPQLVIALLTLLLTWLAAWFSAGLLQRSMRRSAIRPSLKALFGTLLKVLVWTAGILVAITIVFPSLTPAKLLTALGLGSVAIGLAFKDIFENFFAGVLIMLRRPMRIGDYIQCQDLVGKVEHIALRETYLRQTDEQLIIVPNSFLFQNPVQVITDRPLRRFEIVVGVAYGEQLEAARPVIRRALEGLDLVEQDRPVEVYARGFGSSSMDFTVRWWGRSNPLDMHQSRDVVVSAVKAALDEAGIEIPFPYRTLTFKEPLQVQAAGEIFDPRPPGHGS